MIYFSTTGGSQFSDVFTSSGEVRLLRKPKHLEVKEKQRQKRLGGSDGQLADGTSGNLLNRLSCISLPKSRFFFFFFLPTHCCSSATAADGTGWKREGCHFELHLTDSTRSTQQLPTRANQLQTRRTVCWIRSSPNFRGIAVLRAFLQQWRLARPRLKLWKAVNLRDGKKRHIFLLEKNFMLMGSLLLAAWLLKPSQFFSSAASEDGGRGSSPWDPFGRTGGKHAEFKKAGILHPGSLLRPSLWMASWQTRVCQRGNEDGMEKKKRNTHRFLPSLSESLVAVSKSGRGGVGRGGDWRGDRVKETPYPAHSSSSKKTQNLLSSHLECLQRAACLRYRQDQLSPDVAWPILHSFRRLVTPEWLSHGAQLGPSVPGAATCQTALPPPVQTRNYDESCSGRSRSGGAGRNYTNTPLGHIWQ